MAVKHTTTMRASITAYSTAVGPSSETRKRCNFKASDLIQFLQDKRDMFDWPSLPSANPAWKRGTDGTRRIPRRRPVLYRLHPDNNQHHVPLPRMPRCSSSFHPMRAAAAGTSRLSAGGCPRPTWTASPFRQPGDRILTNPARSFAPRPYDRFAFIEDEATGRS